VPQFSQFGTSARTVGPFNAKLILGCAVKVEAIVIFDGVLNTFTDVLCRICTTGDANCSDNPPITSDMESSTSIGLSTFNAING